MAAPRPLRIPPIREALLDIRVASDPPPSIATLQALHSQVRDRYPTVDERRGFKAEIRIESGRLAPPSTEDLGFAGLWCKSADGLQIAQFRPDGFTLNRLAPYASADALIREGLELWEMYRNATQPVSVTRVALRYINTLKLPIGAGDDFADFLTAAVITPPATPQSVSSFLTRAVVHEGEDVCIVTQTFESVGPGEDSPVTLDIDAFRVDDLPRQAPELLGIFARLRQLKNQIFFGYLTDRTVELYQ
jgi:uncharacterized protein (TIGR04255 family)